MRVYISGPISGTDDYVVRFMEVQKKLEDEGHEVVNPVFTGLILPEDFTYEEIMQVDLFLLRMCEAIYMMKNWKFSNGSKRELNLATEEKKIVLYEEKI